MRILTTVLKSMALATASLVLLSSTAQAQGMPGRWSGSAGAATDNRSKDASKSDGDAYAWGAVEWESESRLFYISPAFETIKSGGSDLELELTGGVRPQWAGFDFDVNVAHKWRVDADPGYDSKSWEFTADMKRSIGPASARLRLQHSPDGAGSVKAWTWVAVQGGWDFTEKLNVSAEVGRREQNNSVDYTGYNIGATYAVTRNIDAELRWYGNSAEAPGKQYADALVAGVSVYF